MHRKVGHYASGATVIKRIELVNFMSHERTVIEPSAGLTVLVGPNNCGKSAFVTALQILCHNAKSSYVMRHGEKQCEIIVETNDGHIVKWSKKKSGSAKYQINGQEFDRLRQGIPPELHEILGLSKVDCDPVKYDIHFGEQKSPVFLLNDSGKAAAQFFASSSDAIRLVEMQSAHKNQVRDAKRDQSRLESKKEELLESGEALKPLADIEKRITETEAQFKEIHQSAEKIEHIEILIGALSEVTSSLNWHEAQTTSLGALAEPPKLEDSESLERLLASLRVSNRECQVATAISTAIKDLNVPPKIENEPRLTTQIHDIHAATRKFEQAQATASAFGELDPPPEIKDESKLAVVIGELSTAQQKLKATQKRSGYLSELAAVPKLSDHAPLEQAVHEISKLQDSIANTTNSLNRIEANVQLLEEEVGAWVEQNPTCPTCGSATAVEQVIGAGLSGGHRHG